jgi:hypothetical protein
VDEAQLPPVTGGSRRLSPVIDRNPGTFQDYRQVPAIIDDYPRSSTVIALYLRLPWTTPDYPLSLAITHSIIFNHNSKVLYRACRASRYSSYEDIRLLIHNNVTWCPRSSILDRYKHVCVLLRGNGPVVQNKTYDHQKKTLNSPHTCTRASSRRCTP